MRRLKTAVDATIGALSIPCLLAKARHFDGLVAERDRLVVENRELRRTIHDERQEAIALAKSVTQKVPELRRDVEAAMRELAEVQGINVRLARRLEAAELELGRTLP